MEPQKLLITDAAGVYAWKQLAECYPLYWESGEPIGDDVKAALMDVDALDYWDGVTYWQDDLYVKDDDGLLWSLYQEGDIWAIHPDAEWSDTLEAYYLRPANSVELELPESIEYYLTYGNDGGGYTDEDVAMFERFLDRRYNYVKALEAGFYQVIERSSFSHSNDVPGWLGDRTITVLVDVDAWRECR